MAQARVKARKASVFGGERFALFAESLLTGVWIAVACLGVVTYPAAFAAGARHVRRRTGHEGGGLREFVADFRTAVRRGWLVGVAGWAAAAAVWVDVQAARAGIPGGPLVGAVGLFALIALAVAGLRAAAVWAPGTSWRALLADAVRRTLRDPAGSFLIVAGLAVVALSAGFVAPLAVPVLGAVAAAAVAVEERYRRR
ncbi:hypothetical protein M2164_006996 [Streptomyces sp. SAI-208]|uniref:hypothetical protein n=1 Tax=unclassified Streptomyces TaxID=2593676 RepID=UPI002474DB14|nr:MULTISPECIES: hypothetical protein [unclassified Streptomyces]MDH6520382.1 hypothetical protein [Streptomyces sp. SAI-090]MDH6571685.1 hypothetical protein [Streptomyces sp. SAI-117]MDH6583356.1 hypothetical protein [Streptomyces sp. SAI-133]MDH6611361.1 hypothetical protein [Streptomyces sp. SAI-208]MDH6615528.1 hypothetical protein [Streptomyces sp. SAI-135]